MLRKFSYNQMKLFRFTASVFLVIIYAAAAAAQDVLPGILLNILVMAALLGYIASIFLFASRFNRSKQVLTDELSRQNEAKAAQFTYILLTVAVFAGITFTRFTDNNVSLSYEALFCVLISISAVNDGSYLYFERKDYRNADTDDEN